MFFSVLPDSVTHCSHDLPLITPEKTLFLAKRLHLQVTYIHVIDSQLLENFQEMKFCETNAKQCSTDDESWP